MKSDPTIREIPVVRSILIEDLGSDIYRIESEGGKGEGPKVEFAATKLTLAKKVGELLDLVVQLSEIVEPAKPKRRTRGPNKPRPVLATVPPGYSDKEAGE